MARLVKVASPLGLYAEEFDTETGRHLGNFPQAFSHLALLEAAARIIMAERLEEIGADALPEAPATVGLGSRDAWLVLLALLGPAGLHHRDRRCVDHDGAGETILEAAAPVVVEDRHEAEKQRQSREEEPAAADSGTARADRIPVRRLNLDLHHAVPGVCPVVDQKTTK